MSEVVFYDQSTPSTPASGQELVYTKSGTLRKLNSAGTESSMLDSASYAAFSSALNMYVQYGGV